MRACGHARADRVCRREGERARAVLCSRSVYVVARSPACLTWAQHAARARDLARSVLTGLWTRARKTECAGCGTMAGDERAMGGAAGLYGCQ